LINDFEDLDEISGKLVLKIKASIIFIATFN
jgi:hypothetical protein